MSYRFHKIDEDFRCHVWAKGRNVEGKDPDLWRMDICGYIMNYKDHDKCTEFGWEIDHIFPVALGGTDELSNLQPLHWENNRRKGDCYPWIFW